MMGWQLDVWRYRIHCNAIESTRRQTSCVELSYIGFHQYASSAYVMVLNEFLNVPVRFISLINNGTVRAWRDNIFMFVEAEWK